jgi:hypothetical protein
LRNLVGFFLLAVCPVFSADSSFNGRWDITTVGEGRPRAWWVELKGVGTPGPSGKFVSAYAGDMNIIDKISIENGELVFVIIPKGNNPKAKTQPPRTYRAKLAEGKLDGTVTIEGQTRPPMKWQGVRAPVIKEIDDGTWKEGKPVALFNGKDLTGWKGLNPGAELKWSVKDGVLRNEPPTTDIISERSFWNFKLHTDFRIIEHSNSGIGLRGRYEIQILEDFGKPPGTHSAGALYARVAPSVNASKPAGEWQSYDIRLVGMQVTIVHNGIKVLDKVEIEGLTAIADNADEGEPGPFIVQGDHSYVELKSFIVTPLTK